MKKNIGNLVLLTLGFYYIFGPLRDWAETGDVSIIYAPFVDHEDFLLVFTSILAFMAYSLGAYLTFYYTYPKKQYALGLSLFVGSIVTSIGFRYLLQEVLLPAIWGFSNYFGTFSLRYYVFDNLYYAFVFASFGVIVFLIRFARYQEQQQQAYITENQELQLSLLRSQLNPHFLFNTLNNIYSLIHEQSPKALLVVEKLSHLLRYSLYEKASCVTLTKEWKFVEDFLELQRIRLDYTPCLLLDLPDKLPAVELPPFTLLPLVENAFKHGELRDPNKPVRIKLQTRAQHLVFSVHNHLRQQTKDQVGGIGLENTQRRLELCFPQTADLLRIATPTDHTFQVTLQIPLSLCSVL